MSESAAVPRRALLLSGSTGTDDDALAAACAAALEQHGYRTQALDALRLLGRPGHSARQAVFRAVLAVPGLYDAVHFAALRPGGALARFADAAARRQVVPRLRAHLDEHPADLALSVFATGAAAVSALAEHYPTMTHVVFCPDVTPHRLWVQRNVDLYLVTSGVAEAAVRRFEPDARVQVVPSPVRPAFYQPPSQAAARERLGVPPEERCVLLMPGTRGQGPAAAAAEALGNAGVHVLAAAGRNARLERRLAVVATRQPRVRAIGRTGLGPELMAAADLVITSPGGTCGEARVVGRPLLLLDVVPGHGRDNLQHELELGEASVTSPGAADVARCALAALDRAKPANLDPFEAGGAGAPARSAAVFESALWTALETAGQ
jgi:processive 1,2-diacylglycerol beta-glucosyltransferase